MEPPRDNPAPVSRQPGDNRWSAAVLGREAELSWLAVDEQDAREIARRQSRELNEIVIAWCGNKSIAIYRQGEQVGGGQAERLDPEFRHRPGTTVRRDAKGERIEGDHRHAPGRYHDPVGATLDGQPYQSPASAPQTVLPPPPLPRQHAVDETKLVMEALRELIERGYDVAPLAPVEDLPRAPVLGAEALLYRSGDGALRLQVEGPEEDLDTVLGVVGPLWQYVAVSRGPGLVVFQIPPDESEEMAPVTSDWRLNALIAETVLVINLLLVNFPGWLKLIGVLAFTSLAFLAYQWLDRRRNQTDA
jgi:hypothetical protein